MHNVNPSTNVVSFHLCIFFIPFSSSSTPFILVACQLFDNQRSNAQSRRFSFFSSRCTHRGIFLSIPESFRKENNTCTFLAAIDSLKYGGYREKKRHLDFVAPLEVFLLRKRGLIHG